MWMSAQRVALREINLVSVAYTPNNIGSLEWALQYYSHAAPGELLQGSPGVAWE